MTVGRTRDAGWQVGASRTLGHPVDRVWAALVDDPALWLGPGARLPAAVGEAWAARYAHWQATLDRLAAALTEGSRG